MGNNSNNINEQKDRKYNTYWATGHQHSQMEDDYSEESNPDSVYVTEDEKRDDTITLDKMRRKR